MIPRRENSTVFFLDGTRSGLALVGLFSLATNLLMLTGPLFMLLIYDTVLTGRSVATLVALCLIVLFLFLCYATLEWVRTRSLIRVGLIFDQNVRKSAFRTTIEARLRRIGTTSSPLRDLETVRQFLSGTGLLAFFDLPWVPVYLVIIFLFHSTLGWLALGAGVVLVALALAADLINRGPMQKALQEGERAQAFADAVGAQADVVSGLGLAERMQDHWERRRAGAFATMTRIADRAGGLHAFTKAFRMISQSAILGLGAWLVIGNEISPGTMIAASIIMSRALAPIEQGIATWRQFGGARLAWLRLKRVHAVLPAAARTTKLPAPLGKISVEGLHVMVPGREKPILQNIGFKLEPGAGLGIVGPSGSGKSTLGRCLAGAVPEMRGHVRLDGAEFVQWDRARLGTYVGYMSQEAGLFPGTIAQNIARFAPGRDDTAIVAAARAANLHEIILDLPRGYDMEIGTDGSGLSAGQRQRIGLARALYGSPRLIVLDEPNSHLDPDGERALALALQEARRGGATVVAIAHRPSAVAALDQLLFLHEGRILEFGEKNRVLNSINQRLANPGQKPLAGPPDNPGGPEVQ